MYPHGLIGNCQISALVNNQGVIDWLCLPRPDSPPVFGALLDPDGGFFSICCVAHSNGTQKYLKNSNILVTTLTAQDGSQFKITDFCPRFSQFGRMYRPLSIFRIVEPLKGHPIIKINCTPVNGWEKVPIKAHRGNSHLRYELNEDSLRLTTNMPLTYLDESTAFPLRETLYFALTWGGGVEEDLAQVSNRFLMETINYWDTWVKHCSIPSHYQEETIRSALTLKLHCYEDTGAILAGLTTSLPEEIHSHRNWDYRYCWLRDAYFVLSAFYNLGHFEEMEGFIKFLLNIAEKQDHAKERLFPVYKLDQNLPLPEVEHWNWQGYHHSQPVRSHNQAAEHIQNDVYGEMILTLTPIYFDERFHHLRTKAHEELLEHLAKLCIQNISKSDAGLWEIRNGWKEHSFTNLMCWAGIDRIQKIRENGFLKNITIDILKAKAQAESAIRSAIKDGSLRNGPTDDSLDASLLQMATLRFPDFTLNQATVKKIHQELKINSTPDNDSFLFRYQREDDFGQPKSAFLICSFWLVQALVKIGEISEARKVMKQTMTAANQVGLFSEHYIPGEKKQTGNFPQAYSHVGQINAAFAVSPHWSDVL